MPRRNFLLWAVILALVVPARAMAYLDPGTGSYIFQLVIATIVGAGFALKMYWRRLARWFTRRKPGDGENGVD